jgi:hypothetical protein
MGGDQEVACFVQPYDLDLTKELVAVKREGRKEGRKEKEGKMEERRDGQKDGWLAKEGRKEGRSVWYHQ